MGVTPKCHFLGTPKSLGSPKIPKIKTLNTLEAHNVLCKPLIEVRSKEKL